jgi:hypothetical protein
VRHHLAVVVVFVVAAACGDSGGFPDAYVPPVPPDPGTIDAAWSIVDGTGSATTCANVSATHVNVTITEESTHDAYGQPFLCGNLGGLSGPLPPGTYDLDYSLTDGSGAVLATAPSQTGVVVQSDMTATATPVVFTVGP